MEFFKFKSMAEAKMSKGKCGELSGEKSESKSLSTMSKEIKLLKQMIKTLEESAMKEKNSYQKQLLKKKEEINELNDEVFRLKSNERTLAHQIKAYNNEVTLTSRQRSRDHSRDSQYRSGTARNGSRVSSVESVRRRPLPAPAYPSSGAGLRSRNNSPSLTRNNNSSSVTRGRSNSAGRRPAVSNTDLTSKRYSNPTPPKSLSRVTSLNNSSESIHSHRSSRKPAAFNPTEFVKNKALRQREIEASRKQSQKRPQSRTRTPSSTYPLEITPRQDLQSPLNLPVPSSLQPQRLRE